MAAKAERGEEGKGGGTGNNKTRIWLWVGTLTRGPNKHVRTQQTGIQILLPTQSSTYFIRFLPTTLSVKLFLFCPKLFYLWLSTLLKGIFMLNNISVSNTRIQNPYPEMNRRKAGKGYSLTGNLSYVYAQWLWWKAISGLLESNISGGKNTVIPVSHRSAVWPLNHLIWIPTLTPSHLPQWLVFKTGKRALCKLKLSVFILNSITFI